MQAQRLYYCIRRDAENEGLEFALPVEVGYVVLYNREEEVWEEGEARVQPEADSFHGGFL